MRSGRFLTIAALLLAVFMLQGCAGFRSNRLPQLTAEQIHFSSTPKTRVFSRWNLVIASGKTISDNARVASSAIIKKNFETAINASGCCVIVERLDQADVVVDGTRINENNPAALAAAMLTGLSLYTIPSWMTDTVHLTATAKKGDKTTSYDVSDSMVMVQWLPMALMFPFSGPFETEKSVTANTFSTLVVQMNNDGVFK